MSTPNPLNPVLIKILQEVESMVNTICIGDPLLVGARIGPAVQIFLGQVTLLLPEVGGAGLAVINTDVNAKIGALIAHLQTPPAA